MKNIGTKCFVILLLTGMVLAVFAQNPPADSVFQQLRDVRQSLLTAVQQKNLPGILENLHPDIVFTAIDGETCRGHQEITAYFHEMMTGEDRSVSEAVFDPQSDTLAILYGDDTAIASGYSQDQIKLSNGLSFDIVSRWSATLVRHEGRWKVASLQFTGNLFDNPVLDTAFQAALYAILIGILFGLSAGLVISRKAWAARKRQSA